MRRFFLILSLLGLLFTPVFSQCEVPNSSFESWDSTDVNILTGPSQIWTPESWMPFGAFFPYALFFDSDFNLFETNDARTGSRAVALRPDSTHNLADLLALFPCTAKPQALRGWYKYNGSPLDTITVIVAFQKYDVTYPDSVKPIGTGNIKLTTPAANWTEFTVPVLYVEPDLPDTALISVSYDALNYSQGHELLLDDFAYDNGMGLDNEWAGKEIKVFPNPAQSVCFVEYEGLFDLNLRSLSGQLLWQKQEVDGPTEVDIQDLNTGLYLLEVHTEKGTYWHKIWKH